MLLGSIRCGTRGDSGRGAPGGDAAGAADALAEAEETGHPGGNAPGGATALPFGGACGNDEIVVAVALAVMGGNGTLSCVAGAVRGEACSSA